MGTSRHFAYCCAQERSALFYLTLYSTNVKVNVIMAQEGTISIFIDESGDLGFDFTKKKTTRFFVVTALALNNKRPVEKLVRITHHHLRKSYRMRSPVLHAAEQNEKANERLCKLIGQKECNIFSIILDKKMIHRPRPRHEIYSTMLIKLMRCVGGRVSVGTCVISKQETNRFINTIILNNLEQANILNASKIHISFKTPAEEKCLQAVDMLSWAVFQKYERGRSKFFDNVEKSSLVIVINDKASRAIFEQPYGGPRMRTYSS